LSHQLNISSLSHQLIVTLTPEEQLDLVAEHEHDTVESPTRRC
jgi:hypothetical protein